MSNITHKIHLHVLSIYTKSQSRFVGWEHNIPAGTITKNMAASAAVQFKLITVMTAVTAQWMTNHTELNTNTNIHHMHS